MDSLSESDGRIITVALVCTTVTSIVFYVILALSNASDGGGRRRKGVKDPDDVFNAEKKLCVKEEVLLKMLFETNDRGEGACFVITDPEKEDNPIIYASPAFCNFTQYTKFEVENRNCRFLQGAKTSSKDVEKIREAIRNESEVSVEILNYKRSGESFINQFFLMPLREANSRTQKVAYYLGVQCELKEGATTAGFSQQGKNPGWRIFNWL